MVDRVWECGKNRPIVVQIGRGDLLQLRLKGTKRMYGILIREVFWLALKNHTRKVWIDKNEKRKALGKRALRKPRLLSR